MNSFFRFKQFSIHQEKCAMKVCTDACVFGAWVAEDTQDRQVERILDIGAGTGLLTLMLAQKTTAAIDAIEIDQAASEQAAGNIAASNWADRIKLMNISLQEFKSIYHYDCIICNPPFYEKDLRSDDESINAARHDTTLKLEELMLFISLYLSNSGKAYVLIPWHRTSYAMETAVKQGLFVQKKMLMKQSVKPGYFRTVLVLSKNTKATHETEEISIRDFEQEYTDRFVELLKDYYLRL